VHDVELAGRDAVAAERVERFERLAVEDPQSRRAAARDVEELPGSCDTSTAMSIGGAQLYER